MLKQSFIISVTLILLFSGVASSVFAESVPSWVKNTAKWYGDGQISEKEFLDSIRYLINNKILILDEESNMVEQTVVIVPTPDINELDSLEIRVSDDDVKNMVLSSDLDLLTFKVQQLMQLAENPTIRQVVIDSNDKFRAMKNVEEYISEKDIEWKSTPKGQLSPFMGALIENNISKVLKQKQNISTEQFGDVLFPEIIITNEFGAIVAVTNRTEDYNQGDEFWWILAKGQAVQFKDVLWDESAKIFSADIVIKIENENGQFIGVLKAVTPVR